MIANVIIDGMAL